METGWTLGGHWVDTGWILGGHWVDSGWTLGGRWMDGRWTLGGNMVEILYYKRVLLGRLYALIISFNHKCTPPLALFAFCCKSMVLGAALIFKTENKCSTYFQGDTVSFNLIDRFSNIKCQKELI